MLSVTLSMFTFYCKNSDDVYEDNAKNSLFFYKTCNWGFNFNLQRPTQILAITLLFTSTKDSESRVRGAAIRAITRGILEAGREEDFGLMADITQSVLSLIADSSLFVRTKAAWALSNLTDALLLNR